MSISKRRDRIKKKAQRCGRLIIINVIIWHVRGIGREVEDKARK